MKNKDKYDLRDISYVIKSNNGKYEFVIYYTSIEVHKEIFHGFVSIHDTFTKWLEEEYEPTILTEKEKAYLSAVINPFREKVKYIQKCFDLESKAYIYIYVKKCGSMIFPTFRKGTMYKGMEEGRKYTLEELGL